MDDKIQRKSCEQNWLKRVESNGSKECDEEGRRNKRDYFN